MIVFFKFLIFFGWFSGTFNSGRVGKKRNDNFYFLSFSAFFNLLWLEKMPWWCFLIFWICLLLFCNFLLRFWQERNGMIIFIFSLSQSFWPILPWNEAVMVFFNFLNFFATFFEFSMPGRVGTKRKDKFYFFSFSAYSNLFWLEKKP